MVRKLQHKKEINKIIRPNRYAFWMLLLCNSFHGFATHHWVGDKASIFHATVKPEIIADVSGIHSVDKSAMLTLPFTCPNDVNLSCSHYSGNPDDYGQPTPNPGFSITILSYHVNNATNSCGIGQITRTWSIQSNYGTTTCVQRININSGGNFGPGHINWPPDYDIDGCIGSTHPSDLPPPFDRPTWTNVPCTMIGTSYHDQTIFVGGGGCKKILRTWKVMDWCQYETNQHPPVGLWTHVQVIKFKDDQPPIITFCPEDRTVSNGSDCHGVYVQLAPLTATDNCTQQLQITNNFNSGGANASGYYPLGTTRVVFTVRDDCGNTSTCATEVEVRDGKNPTAIAYHGLGVTLMQHPSGPKIEVNASLFNAGSFDNCTPAHQLTFALEPNVFTCENLGENTVKFIVYDQSGNSGFVYTYLIVQDNMGICPDSLIGGLVSGKISTHTGEPLEEIEISLKGEGFEAMVLSDDNGVFSRRPVPRNKELAITPGFDGSLIHGIDLRDLVILRRHLLGIDKLQNPYRLLSADFDGSGHISVQDYIQMRFALLLGLESFPGLASWKFIDKKYEFLTPENPFEEDLPLDCTIQVGQSDVKGVDFIGIKMGDLDNSYYKDVVEGRSLSKPVEFVIGNPESSGGLFRVPVYILRKEKLLAFQMILNSSAAIVDVEPNGDLSYSLFTFNDSAKTDNWYISWDDVFPVEFSEKEPVFYLVFSQRPTADQLDNLITVGINNQSNQSLDANWTVRPVHLKVKRDNNSLTAMEVYPNPVSKDDIRILLHSEMQTDGFVQVWNTAGSLIYRQDIQIQQGSERIVIPSGAVKVPGVYMINVSSDGGNLTKRIVVLD